MSEPLTLDPSQLPDISNLVLEDDTPLDSFINEKQQRLLTTVLYSGGDTGITVPFIAAANVGLFSSVRLPGIAPDVFLVSILLVLRIGGKNKCDRIYFGNLANLPKLRSKLFPQLRATNWAAS